MLFINDKSIIKSLNKRPRDTMTPRFYFEITLFFPLKLNILILPKLSLNSIIERSINLSRLSEIKKYRALYAKLTSS